MVNALIDNAAIILDLWPEPGDFVWYFMLIDTRITLINPRDFSNGYPNCNVDILLPAYRDEPLSWPSGYDFIYIR